LLESEQAMQILIAPLGSYFLVTLKKIEQGKSYSLQQQNLCSNLHKKNNQEMEQTKCNFKEKISSKNTSFFHLVFSAVWTKLSKTAEPQFSLKK
jgi:hypothetical protein